MTRRIEAEHFLIATGAEPVIPPILGLAGSGYLTSTTAMERAALPESMIVLGGGPVAMEQAQIARTLGLSRRTVINRLNDFMESSRKFLSQDGLRAAPQLG